MIVNGISPSAKLDVFDFCKRLTLKAVSDDEHMLLAELFKVLVDGGKITINANESNRSEFVYEVPDITTGE